MLFVDTKERRDPLAQLAGKPCEAALGDRVEIPLWHPTGRLAPRFGEALLRSNALYQPCADQGSFATCFAQALQALRKLRSFKLNFELCEFTLNSAALIAGSLPASLRKLQFDCDGVVNASDTRERWEEILQPLIARFGDGVQVPRGSDCRNA
mmetsp:Transcript_13422/g.31965  ORF Transcript_13422/g.31965 Transcript_13422/m.31965 type:complete len:153 (+) Transcript_13422:1278-1736(+)